MEINQETFGARGARLVAPPVQPPARGFDPDALTRALRIAGAALVVGSASTFMLQHWQGGNDLIRYAMLVGQSLLLAAAAYFVGLSLREGRSARTLLALVLATMPVGFAVLGGLVYSQFHLETLAPLPSYATWVAPSRASAVVAVLATLAVYVPLAVIALVALARKQAKLLTLAFFAANLMVVVPVRQPLTVVVLAGVMLLALLRLELTHFVAQAQLDTLEGKLARGMPFFAPLIMLGRVFHLYQVRAPFVGGVLLIAAAALWLALTRTATAWKRDSGAWAAAGLSILGWGLCWSELARVVDSSAIAALGWGLPSALLLTVASRRAVQTRDSMLGVATAGALGTTLLACGLQLGGISAVSCIVVGVAVAVWGASMRALVRTVSGSLVALFGLVAQVWLATHEGSVLRRASLSVVGVLLIVGSAYVERNRGKIASAWQAAAARRLAGEEPVA